MTQILAGRWWLLLCAALSCASVTAFAQPPSIDATNSRENGSTLLREGWPRIVYVEKENGELIPLVDLPWTTSSKFLNMLGDIARGVEPTNGSTAKSHSLKELSLDVVAKERHAVINVTLRVNTLVDGMQFIPIEMPECHFTSMPTSKDGGDVSVSASFNREAKVNEIQLVGVANQTYEISFEMQVPLRKIGRKTRLELSLPRAAKSSFVIEIPNGEVVPDVEEGQIVDLLDADEGKTKFTQTGLLPRFSFGWRPPLVQQEENSAYEATCDIDVTIDARGMVNSDARLLITSFNRPLDQVIVRLPPKTRLKDLQHFGYSVSDAGQTEDGRKEVLIRFDSDIKSPPIRLQVQSDRGGETDNSNMYELTGFEVIGATSTSGTVDLFSEAGDWRLNCTTDTSVRRVTNLNSTQAKASYVYTQPNQIRLSLQRQKPEVTVEPRYWFSISETEVEVTTVFVCSVRGAYPATLKFNTGQQTWKGMTWRIRGTEGPISIDPEDLDNELVELPIDATTDRFEIELTGSIVLNDRLRAITAREEVLRSDNGSGIDLILPHPVDVKTLLQATIAISAAPNVMVSQQRDTNTDYFAIPRPDWVIRNEEISNAEPLCFQTRTVGVPPRLVLLAATVEGEVSVDCETEILSVTNGTLRVSQTMQWTAKEAGLRLVWLTLDKETSESGKLDFTVNGEPAYPKKFGTFFDIVPTRRTTVTLPIDDLGSFELNVTYDWQPPGFGSQVNLPLLLPKRDPDSLIKRMTFTNRLRKPRVAGYAITLANSTRTSIDSKTWATRDAAGDPDIVAYTDEFSESIPLDFQRTEISSEPTQFRQLVDLAWFQTWYTETQRRDRATFQISGGSDVLRIELPTSMEPNQVQVWVDRESVVPRDRGDYIELAVEPKESHVVEIMSPLYAREKAGVLKTEVPRIQDADIFGQWYWHVVMPKNECMVMWPRSLTRAHKWDWSSLFPQHKLQQNQSELENWSRARSVNSNVLWGSTEYLFGAMGEPGTLSIRTMPLPVYVIAVAGSLMLLGLMLLYASRRHRVWILCVAGLLIAGFVFLHPSYAAVGGQVSVLGVLLAVLAAVLSWLMRQSVRSSTLFGIPLSRQSLRKWLSTTPPSTPQHGSSAGSGTTTLAAGSSKFRTVE